MKALAVVVVVLGCGHSEPKPAERPATTPAATTTPASEPAVAAEDSVTCEAMTKRVLAFGNAQDAEALYLRHCRDDMWSEDYRRCVLTSNTWDEAVACGSKLTKAQLQAIAADADAQGFVVAKPPPGQ